MQRTALGLVVATGLLLFLAVTVLADAPQGMTGAWQQDGKPGQPIVVRWSTETEVNTAGFNVYRAESEEGPWTKVNRQLIPGSTDPLRGGTYVFTDTQVLAGKMYWYELEEVELSGQTTRLERTSAVARPQGLNLLGALSCPGASSLMLFSLLGVILFKGKSVRAVRRGPTQ